MSLTPETITALVIAMFGAGGIGELLKRIIPSKESQKISQGVEANTISLAALDKRARRTEMLLLMQDTNNAGLVEQLLSEYVGLNYNSLFVEKVKTWLHDHETKK